MNWLRRAFGCVVEWLRSMSQGRAAEQPEPPSKETYPATPTPSVPSPATDRAERVVDIAPHDAERRGQASPENSERAPVVQGVHESYLPLQRRAIHAVFRMLGIHHIPGLLLSFLHDYDARYALFHFCEPWKVSYAALMDPTDPDHLTAGASLRCAVGFLIEVEQTANGARLDPGPVYEALYRSTEEAEHLLDQLRRVALVTATLRNVHLTFEPIKRLAASTLARLSNWSLLEEPELLRAEQVARKLTEYEDQFGRAHHLIEEALREIGSADGGLKEVFRKEYEKLLEQRRAILSDLSDVERDFEAKLEDFGRVANLLRDLAKRVSSHAQFGDWSRPGGLTLRNALAILGLQIGVSFAEAKSAYRRLALQFHPDRRPDDPDATEKFQRINAAYQFITAQFVGGMA